MRKLICLTTISLSLLCASQSSGETRGFQASLLPDIALHSRETRIEGVSLSIWGENPQSSLALGFINGSTGVSKGFSLGLVNYAEQYSGAYWSLVNVTSGDFTGWQGGPAIGLVGSVLNYCGGEMSGFQSGIINLAGGMSGFQLGVLNYTQRMEAGLQVGLINLIGDSSGWFTNFPNEVAPGMILANWKF